MRRWCRTGASVGRPTPAAGVPAVSRPNVIAKHLRELKKQYHLIQYIGIAADEAHRCKDLRYPLVEWGMTEADCLNYCHARGFTWGGLYKIFRRVSCWCCPLQPISELRKLRAHYPELWQKLLYMDAHTWQPFRPDYTAQQLETRFALEEERAAQGLPNKGRAFYAALRDRLAEKEAPDP